MPVLAVARLLHGGPVAAGGLSQLVVLVGLAVFVAAVAAIVSHYQR